jgi:hypothetical protein
MSQTKISHTINQIQFCAPSGTGSFIPSDESVVSVPQRSAVVGKAVQNAVYGYIQAIRALGRDKVDSSEIAEALSLPITDVEQALALLRGKGVKLLRVL